MPMLMLGLRCLDEECAGRWAATVTALRLRRPRCPFCHSLSYEVTRGR
jgi:hypothetical protein